MRISTASIKAYIVIANGRQILNGQRLIKRSYIMLMSILQDVPCILIIDVVLIVQELKHVSSVAREVATCGII